MERKYNLLSFNNNFIKKSGLDSELIVDYSGVIEPDLSITIPTYKRPHLIKHTLDSIREQKTNINYEVIIIDDDAEGEFFDEMCLIIHSYKDLNLKYYKNIENLGLFGNWNRCIELSSAKWFSILNDDDVLNPSFIQTAFETLIRDHSIKMVTTIPIHFSEQKELKKLREVEKYFSYISMDKVLDGHFTNGTLGTIYNREIALELGGFDEELYPISDYFFAIKYVYMHKCAFIDKNLAYVRWMENESMKINVVQGFIEQDFIMWNDVISFLLESEKIGKLESKLLLYRARMKTIVKIPGYKKQLSLDDSTQLLQAVPFDFKFYERILNYLYPRVYLRYIHNFLFKFI